MSLTPETIACLRRLAERRRGDAAAPPPSHDPVVDALFANQKPEHYDDLRLWLHRLCLFLPKEFFHKVFSIEATRSNVQSQFVYELTYAAELTEITRICNRYSIPHPTTAEKRYWTAREVADNFQALLSTSGCVRCICNHFVLMTIKSHPHWHLAQTVILEPEIQGTPRKRWYRRRR